MDMNDAEKELRFGLQLDVLQALNEKITKETDDKRNDVLNLVLTELKDKVPALSLQDLLDVYSVLKNQPLLHRQRQFVGLLEDIATNTSKAADKSKRCTWCFNKFIPLNKDDGFCSGACSRVYWEWFKGATPGEIELHNEQLRRP